MHPFTECSPSPKRVIWRIRARILSMEKSWQLPDGLVPRESAELAKNAQRPSGVRKRRPVRRVESW